MTSTNLRHWLSRGELEKLENVVLEGRGSRLLGEQSPDLRTRIFLRGLPNYLTKISQIHDAVVRGSLVEVIRLVDGEPKKKLVSAKDAAGTPLIHKAVYYDHQNVLEWIVDNYPATVEQKDREGRTALHYCAACRDPEAAWDVLVGAGCDASVCDGRSNPAAYYLRHGSEIELPDAERMAGRRRRHRDPSKWAGALDFKPSNIRIWIHNRDIGRLQHVLWEGHGSKLRCETSNNTRVKRFLEAVPFIMGTIKEIHSATIKNDIEGFRNKMEEPISPIILSSKDSNGLNVLHKAAGLGYMDLTKEILERYPTIVNSLDNEGKTPLHYAAICRDGGVMYNLLLENGADENKVDNRHKTAAYYKNRPADVDLTSLVMVPEAPRVSGTSYPRHWDWRIIDSELPRVRRTTATGEDSAFGSAESAKLGEEDLATPEMENAEDDVNGIEATEEEDNADVEDDDVDATENTENEPTENEEIPPEDEGEPPATDGENLDEETQEMPGGEGETDNLAADSNNNEDHDETETAEEAPENDENPKSEEAAIEEATLENNEETGENEAEPEESEETPQKTEETPEATEGAADETEASPDEIKGTPEETKSEDEQEAEAEEDEKADPSTTDSGVGNTPNDEEQPVIEDGEEDGGEEGSEEAAPAAPEEPEEEEEDGEPADEEAARLVEQGSMEQLAALVLTGEGHRLVGRSSSNPELQAFIDNVPAYMAKIRVVHKAARDGNLKDLQISLDRRKFAIAKDPSSPHGATPLHVAVIFGHTPVVRYLAGRFPETAHALDLDGRTPLHYAAILADNGHYYNLLLNLGANPLVQDNFGQKADYYKQHQDDLSHKQLLRDFGASESLADDMLSDKDLKIFQDEEGRYLASSLGDPLIKGLTEVASARPKDPVTYLATYLYNFANKGKNNESLEDPNILIIPADENIEDEEESQEDNQDVEGGVEQDVDQDNDDGYPQSPDLDAPESLFAETARDENGQSALHFAVSRSHTKDGLYHMLQERQINIALRDAQYNTGRDIAELSGNRDNVKEIDRFVVYLAARGETDKLVELLMEGYDHILDTEDEGKNILQITEEEDNKSTAEFLKSIKNYTELRNEIHRAIRAGDANKVRQVLEMNGDGARLLALGKNTTGRCSLHIAVLCEHEDIVRYIAKNHPETLRIGDNLDRTALHYAMGVPSVENMSIILIKAGAKRVHKDLRSRQPSYYFLNKTDIKHLQEEEESLEK